VHPGGTQRVEGAGAVVGRHVDGADGVGEHHHGVAGGAGVQRRRLDAVVERQAGHHHPLDAPAGQELGQLGLPGAVFLNLRLASLEHPEVGLDLQVRVELPSRRALHAVHRPRPALLDEGGVVGRVAVLAGGHGLEPGGKLVDERHDLVALGNGEAAPRAEVDLHVGHDQGVVRVGREHHLGTPLSRFFR
jgi:hypothetical protein